MSDNVVNLVNNGTRWFPEAIATYSKDVDSLFYVILYGSIIISLCMFVIGVFFLVKYKRTNENQKAVKQVTHNDPIEILWTVIPTILVMFIFYFGYKGYLNMAVPPKDAMQINVTGKKWAWEFEYPTTGLRLDKEFFVPVNTPVKLIMTSKDVIHSFYIPNFRIKKDVLPNRYTKIWFEATKEGSYQVFCTEYCGDAHSHMLATVTVLSEAKYAEWLEQGDPNKALPLPELGKKLYTGKSCNTCHSVDGSEGIGPTWKGLFGSKRELQSGESVVADENYITESIQEPMAKIVKGRAPVMPIFDTMSEREISGLIEYIKTLK